MEFRPIISAMCRNKVGAIVIGIQMAITLAILCNALFIIQQRLAFSHRPSGADEENAFAMLNQWVGTPRISQHEPQPISRPCVHCRVWSMRRRVIPLSLATADRAMALL